MSRVEIASADRSARRVASRTECPNSFRYLSVNAADSLSHDLAAALGRPEEVGLQNELLPTSLAPCPSALAALALSRADLLACRADLRTRMAAATHESRRSARLRAQKKVSPPTAPSAPNMSGIAR